MYCVKCGVKLSDTEKICPLCDTVVYHPDVKQGDARPLYPTGRRPKPQANPKVFNGFLIVLFSIAILICYIADTQRDGGLDWFGLAVGGILLGYIFIALPLWFKKPNPVIFVPCDFAATMLYLLYINIAVGGSWFLSFALPITAAICLIVCTVITLTRYLKRGWLYIFGGALIAMGGLMILLEFLLDITFSIDYIGWSIYPLIVLALLGCGLIYLGIDRSAREYMEQKLFF